MNISRRSRHKRRTRHGQAPAQDGDLDIVKIKATHTDLAVAMAKSGNDKVWQWQGLAVTRSGGDKVWREQGLAMARSGGGKVRRWQGLRMGINKQNKLWQQNFTDAVIAAMSSRS